MAENTTKTSVTEIDWDCEDKNELAQLPKEVVIYVPNNIIPNDDTEDRQEFDNYIAEYLSNNYGYCISAFIAYFN